MGELYKLDFASGKSYIGITTKTAAERFKGHKKDALRGAGACVYNAWRKHGEPRMTVLAVLEDGELASTEQRAIAAYGTFVPGGYNMTVGGDVSPMHSPVVAEKVSKAKVHAWFDKKYAAKMSASSKALWLDPAYREKTLAASAAAQSSAEFKAAQKKRNQDLWLDPTYRNAVSAGAKKAQADPELKRKQSESMKLRWQDPAFREKCLSKRFPK